MEILGFLAFCLIALVVICAIIGAKSQPPKRYRKYARYVCDDFDDDTDFHVSAMHLSTEADETDDEFYGGIPFGDGKIYMTDDDDFIDEFGDDVLQGNFMGCDIEYFLDHDFPEISAADFLAEFKRRVAPLPVVLTGMDESPYANNAVPDDCWEIDCFFYMILRRRIAQSLTSRSDCTKAAVRADGN